MFASLGCVGLAVTVAHHVNDDISLTTCMAALSSSSSYLILSKAVRNQ